LMVYDASIALPRVETVRVAVAVIIIFYTFHLL